jgi:hypothetical protein
MDKILYILCHLIIVYTHYLCAQLDAQDIVKVAYSNIHIELWDKCVDCPGGAIQKNKQGKQERHELHAFRLYYQPLFKPNKDQIELFRILK